MHSDRMREVADLIERNGPEHFDMCGWFDYRGAPVNVTYLAAAQRFVNGTPYCGTTACVGGTAEALLVRSLPLDYTGTIPRPETWLGLDPAHDERGTLFYPGNAGEGGWDWTRQPGERGYIAHDHAVRMLRLCADRGDARPYYWDECARPD